MTAAKIRDVRLREQLPTRIVKNGGLMPKTEPYPGFLRAETVTCGKPACHCARGYLHGPYWYRRRREGGRQRRAYVKPAELQSVRAGPVEWAHSHPPAYRLRQELVELRRPLRELDGGW